jgi:hypothetical protein
MPEETGDEASHDDAVPRGSWKRKMLRASLYTVGGSSCTALFIGGWPLGGRTRRQGPLLGYLPHGFAVFALYTLAVLVLMLLAGIVLYVLALLLFAARCFWKASQQIEDPDVYDRWSDLATRALSSFRGVTEGFRRLPAQFLNRSGAETSSRSEAKIPSRSSKTAAKKKRGMGRHRKEARNRRAGGRPSAEENTEDGPPREITSHRADAAWKAVREEQLRTALRLALLAHLSQRDEYEVNREIVDNVLRDIAGESDIDVPKPTPPGDDSSPTRTSDE